ncbi:hypothetical protein BHM03_00002810, partial [Ensete ventricosum]
PRIKKIMQADEDVGKIALAVPILVCKFLRSFVFHCAVMRLGEARRGPSTSFKGQATRFNEVSPGRSPEPKHRALRASAQLI